MSSLFVVPLLLGSSVGLMTAGTPELGEAVLVKALLLVVAADVEWLVEPFPPDEGDSEFEDLEGAAAS